MLSSSSAPSHDLVIDAPSGVRIRPEAPEDDAAIDALNARVFGPARLTKASQRVREQAPHRVDLSFTAWSSDRLVGSVRLTPVRVGEEASFLLGPLAVDSVLRGRGTGLALLHAASEAARKAEAKSVLLVGDPPYYARAGYARVPGPILMPAPHDPARLLGIEFADGALAGLKGVLRGDMQA